MRYRPDWSVVRDSDAAVPMVAMTRPVVIDDGARRPGSARQTRPPRHQEDGAAGGGAQPVAQALDFVVHLDQLADGRRVVVEVVEVAGFDGRRCATNTIAGVTP